jgi:hypothetical protein
MDTRIFRSRTLFAAAALLFSAASVSAAPVTVAWDANPEPDIIGYRVSYGTTSGLYSATVSVASATTVDIDGLRRGGTYYFVVQAVNEVGQLSDPSAEVAYAVPMYPPQDPVFYSPATGAWSAAMTDVANPGGTPPAMAAGWTVRDADFNDDGYTDLLLYNATTGEWWKATNVGHGKYSYAGGYRWSPGWTPYVADFNGDGMSDVFLYNSTTGRWYLALADGPGDFSYVKSGAWSPGWTITIANLDGNNRADMFLYNPAVSTAPNAGRWFRVMTLADLNFEYHEGQVKWSAGWEIYPGDFDGNGWGDVFVYNRTNGRWFEVTFDGDVATYHEGLWTPGWNIYPADFDADGRTDLFVYNQQNGRWFEVMSQGSSFNYVQGQWSPDWLVHTADIDHDGRTDLTVYNTTSGRYFQVTTLGLGAFDYLMGTASPNALFAVSGNR